MNVNVTKIQRLSNGIIQFYNGSDIVDSFSVTSSVSIGFESNLAKTIIFSSSVKTLSFNVFNIIALYGSTSNKIYSAGIDPSDTSSAYVNRLYDIYGFLISDVIQGCCPGPTFVGGVVASYPNFASFPATGQQSVIYIDESTNQAYYWDGTSYQLLTSTGVETYPNFASFPVTGMANIIYVDLSVPESYVWNGSVYVSLDGGSVAWGSIIGTLSAQTDLQTALNAKQATLVSGTNIKTVNSTSLLGSGNLAVGTVTSVGLTMPSAFNVASSPITTSGTLAVTGAGVVSQYVRGDGSLANFPASSGGGASLSYYLNGSVSQGTFGGVAMKEMDRTPIFGAGTDFSINANGYIQSFITDANVPNLLEIPGGNWNFETYFSASSGGGTPSFYVELYKWDGATLSLIASNSANPEGITNGTTIDAYFSALAVPQTTLLATDRLAIRIYVTHSGRTITLHTENSHLCQVITTFSTGLTALNGLTAQVQNFATGTAGTDFGISSATSTHTFNLPTASAANRGALSSADWTMFNSKVPATRTLTINGTTQDLSADRTFTIATGLTVGTTPITSGTIGRVLFEGIGNVLQQSGSLFWDNTNGRLGIGTSSPTNLLSIQGDTFGSGHFLLNSQLPSRHTQTVGFKAFWPGANSSLMASTAFAVEGWTLNANLVRDTSLGWTCQDTGRPAWHTFALYGQNADVFGIERTAATAGSAALVRLFSIFGTGNVAIGSGTDAGFKLDVNGTARVSGELTVFKGLTASGRIATFYGFQSPYQLEASIEVGMQSTDEGVALIGGSNIQNNRGGFLQTKNGQRAISWNVLGIVSIGTPQITSSQYSALSIGGGQATLGSLVPNTTGVQLAVLSKAISHSGSASTQAAISFNSFASSSLIANVFSTTYTDAYNVYIAGPPTAGNNVTLTNTYALYINSGKTYLGGNTLIGTTTDAGFKLDVNGTARVSGILTLSTSGQITSGTNSLIFTSTGTPSRIMSWDAVNSNINLLAGGFGEGYFLGTRFSTSRTNPTFVTHDGLNDAGNAKITAYDGNGNPSIQASNNGNRSIVLKGLGTSGAVLIGNITTGNGTAYSAILQADSTTQGFLPPRMTTTQKNAISSPATGLVVYDSTLNVLNFYNGSSWTSGSSGGTVTSVAALTLGTTGADLSSTVANGTTTPVITLNVPTASAANRGALSASDWTTFNGKQDLLVSGTNIVTVNNNTLLGSGNLTIRDLPSWVETNTTDRTIWNNGKGNIVSNTSFGDSVLRLNTTGTFNTAFGAFVLDVNTTGGYNTAVGYNALGSNTTASQNVAIGYNALLANITGTYNTAVGFGALAANTTDDNTAVGGSALTNNTTGSQNVAMGSATLVANTTGGNNTALGTGALTANTTGIQNTAVGRGSLQTLTTGSQNTAIGYNTDSPSGFSGSTILGANAAATASNQFVVGSATVNAGTVVAEINTSTRVWNVIINGVARKILLA